MRRNLHQAVAGAPRTEIRGEFERHVSENWRVLDGSNSGGRWGPPGQYPVLYLGRPRASVTIEAYRHLVDPYVADGMTAELVAARRILACMVDVTEILDLRLPEAQRSVGLGAEDLVSPVDDYEACQRVGRIAHQLGLHGVFAPAATRMGETLALFERHLPAAELPVLVREEVWEHLPADPRRLRLVGEQEGTA